MRSLSPVAGVFWFVCLVLSVSARADGVTPPAAPLDWSREAFQREVVLIETKPRAGGLFSRKDVESQAKRSLTAQETALLDRDDTGDWRRYEDELLAFDLPDDPLLQVNVVRPGDTTRLSVVGSRVGTTDNRFNRAYRITIGAEMPYLLLLVSEASEFDNGICLCGAIAFEKLQVVDGQARRFSLLYGGAVKKVQVLGGGRRAVLLEWTHTSLTPSAYARIAASIRFAGSKPRSLAECVEATPAWERIGWLERGDDTNRLKELMGPPDRVAGDEWVYVRDERHADGRGYRSTLTVPMTGGTFGGFHAAPSHETELTPPEGSLAWAEMVVGTRVNGDGTPPAVGQTKADKQRVLARFLEEPVSSGDVLWDEWCEVASTLHRQGIQDPRVPVIVERHYAEDAPHRGGAARVLNAYRVPNRIELFAARARLLLERSSPRNAIELEALYGYLGRNHPDIEALIERGLKHDDAEFRTTALRRANLLSPRKAMEAARRALETDSNQVNRGEAARLLGRFGGPDDLPWLEARLAQERSEWVRKIIVDVVRELTPKKKPASRGTWK